MRFFGGRLNLTSYVHTYRTTNLSCSLLHVDCEVKMPTIMSSQCWSLLVLKLSKHIYNPGGEGPEDSRREAGSRGVEGSLEWRRSVALKMRLVSRSKPIQMPLRRTQRKESRIN